MAILKHEHKWQRLDRQQLDQWSNVPPAVASDCQNRDMAMHGRIKPIARGTRLCGQARTVTCMIGDNGAIHRIACDLQPGEILVIDAGGDENIAVFGGLLAHQVLNSGGGGVVLDGALRDVAEIRELGLGCYCAATAPRGPHKGFGGRIDGPISCGGIIVNAGDLVLADDDGVAIVPLGDVERIAKAAVAKLAQEAELVERIANGEKLADMLKVPMAEPIK